MRICPKCKEKQLNMKVNVITPNPYYMCLNCDNRLYRKHFEEFKVKNQPFITMLENLRMIKNAIKRDMRK